MSPPLYYQRKIRAQWRTHATLQNLLYQNAALPSKARGTVRFHVAEKPWSTRSGTLTNVTALVPSLVMVVVLEMVTRVLN
jgi:hypothetical protein